MRTTDRSLILFFGGDEPQSTVKYNLKMKAIKYRIGPHSGPYDMPNLDIGLFCVMHFPNASEPQAYFFNTAVGHVLGSMCQFNSSPTVSGCCPISKSSTMMNKPMRGFSTGSKPNRLVDGVCAVN